MKNKLLGFALALIAIFFWSVHTIAIRYMVNDLEISTLLLVFLRFFLGNFLLIFISSFFIKKSDIKKNFGNKNNIFKNKNFWFTSFSLKKN